MPGTLFACFCLSVSDLPQAFAFLALLLLQSFALLFALELFDFAGLQLTTKGILFDDLNVRTNSVQKKHQRLPAAETEDCRPIDHRVYITYRRLCLKPTLRKGRLVQSSLYESRKSRRRTRSVVRSWLSISNSVRSSRTSTLYKTACAVLGLARNIHIIYIITIVTLCGFARSISIKSFEKNKNCSF